MKKFIYTLTFFILFQSFTLAKEYSIKYYYIDNYLDNLFSIPTLGVESNFFVNNINLNLNYSLFFKDIKNFSYFNNFNINTGYKFMLHNINITPFIGLNTLLTTNKIDSYINLLIGSNFTYYIYPETTYLKLNYSLGQPFLHLSSTNSLDKVSLNTIILNNLEFVIGYFFNKNINVFTGFKYIEVPYNLGEGELNIKDKSNYKGFQFGLEYLF